MVWPTLGSRKAKEQNRTAHATRYICTSRCLQHSVALPSERQNAVSQFSSYGIFYLSLEKCSLSRGLNRRIIRRICTHNDLSYVVNRRRQTDKHRRKHNLASLRSECISCHCKLGLTSITSGSCIRCRKSQTCLTETDCKTAILFHFRCR